MREPSRIPEDQVQSRTDNKSGHRCVNHSETAATCLSSQTRGGRDLNRYREASFVGADGVVRPAEFSNTPEPTSIRASRCRARALRPSALRSASPPLRGAGCSATRLVIDNLINPGHIQMLANDCGEPIV